MTCSCRAAVATAVAVAAAAAAAQGAVAVGDQTERVVDRTISCSVPVRGGVNLLEVGASPRQRPIESEGKLEAVPASVWVDVGPSGNLLWLALVSADKSGYVLEGHLCAPAGRIPLARASLPLLGVFRARRGSVSRECWVASRISLRLRVVLRSSGKPLAAQLAIRTGRQHRPVAFIEWSPARVRAFVSAGFCHAA